VTAIDSCSAEGSFMAQLWSGRRKMADLLLDVGPGTSLTFWLEVVRQRAYLQLRKLRDRARSWSMPVAPKKVGLTAPR
jgi:hypothetical protein